MPKVKTEDTKRLKVNISSKLEEFDELFIEERNYSPFWNLDGNHPLKIKTFIRQMAEELLEASRLESRELAQEKILDNTDTEYRKEGFNQAVRDQSQLINDLKE